VPAVPLDPELPLDPEVPVVPLVPAVPLVPTAMSPITASIFCRAVCRVSLVLIPVYTKLPPSYITQVEFNIIGQGIAEHPTFMVLYFKEL
jgi:hypothetical protein